MATSTTRRPGRGRRADASGGSVARRLRAACARTGWRSSAWSSSSCCCSSASSGRCIAPWPYDKPRTSRPSSPTAAGRCRRCRPGHILGHRPARARPAQPPARRRPDQRDRRVRRPGRRSCCIGVPIGALAGWFGGRLDNLLMRFTDVIYAFPDLLFIILLSVAFRETAFGQALDGLLLVFVAIGLTSWVTVARLVRGQLLSLKETEFVEAATAIGVSRSQDRHPAPAAQRDRARSSSPSPSASRARSWPRRRSPTSASASSRRARRGAASSPRARSTSAPSRTWCVFPAICIAARADQLHVPR